MHANHMNELFALLHAGARQVLLGRLFGSSADAAADLLHDWMASGAPPWFDEDGLLILTPPALKVCLWSASIHLQLEDHTWMPEGRL